MKKSVLLGIVMTGMLFAAPAFERVRIFTQPDGSAFAGTLRGDEYLHWIETASGDIVVFSKQNGRFERAAVGTEALLPSGRPYHEQNTTMTQDDAAALRDALRRLWHKKRAFEMQRRQATAR